MIVDWSHISDFSNYSKSNSSTILNYGFLTKPLKLSLNNSIVPIAKWGIVSSCWNYMYRQKIGCYLLRANTIHNNSFINSFYKKMWINCIWSLCTPTSLKVFQELFVDVHHKSVIYLRTNFKICFIEKFIFLSCLFYHSQNSQHHLCFNEK